MYVLCVLSIHFDETHQGQPVVPVKKLATTSASPVAQGYSDTLGLLSVLRSDYPHVPQGRWRPNVEPFVAHPLTDSEGQV